MIKDTLTVFGSRLASRGATFVVLLLVARSLSPEDLGYYGFVSTTVYSFLYIASAGLRTSGARAIGADPAAEGEVIFVVGGAWILLGLFAGTVAFVVFHQYGAPVGVARDVSLLAASGLIPMLLWYLAQGVFLGTGDVRSFSLAEVGPRYSLLAIVGLLLVFDRLTLRAAVLGFVVSHAATAVIAAVRVAPRRSPVPFRAAVTRFSSLVAEGMTFAVVMGLIAAAPALALFAGGLSLGAEASGSLYSVLRLTEVIGEAATAVGLVTFSTGARSKDSRQAIASSLRVARTITYAASAAALAIAIVATPLIRYSLGEAHLTAVAALRVFALMLPFVCFSRVVIPGLAAQGIVRESLYLELGALLVNAVLLFSIAGRLGIAGVAAALAVSRIAACLGYAFMAASRAGLSLREAVLPGRAEVVSLIASMRRFRAASRRDKD